MYTFYRKHIYISCWKLWIFCASMVRWSLLIHQDPPGSTCPAIGPEMEDSLVLHPVSPWQQTWGFHMEALAESGRTVGHPSFEPGKTMDKLLNRLFDGLCCSMGYHGIYTPKFEWQYIWQSVLSVLDRGSTPFSSKTIQTSAQGCSVKLLVNYNRHRFLKEDAGISTCRSKKISIELGTVECSPTERTKNIAMYYTGWWIGFLIVDYQFPQ